MKKYAIWQNHHVIGYIGMTEHQKETINSIHDIGIYIGKRNENTELSKLGVKELKQMIVDLKMELIKESVPNGNCPYAYYNIGQEKGLSCGDIECRVCKLLFLAKMRKNIEEKIEQL